MLNEFISTIGTQDVARQNRFAVSVHGPGGLADREINMLCESVSFPGQNIRTTGDSLRAGPAREVGQGVTYGPITLRFVCRPGLTEKKYFENWQELMFNKETWQASYYKDYIGEIKLDQLDRFDRSRYSVTIYEAYPKIITEQDFSYQSDNAYQTLSVQFTYWYWDSNNTSREQLMNKQGARRSPPPTTAKKGKGNRKEGDGDSLTGGAEHTAVDDFSDMPSSGFVDQSRSSHIGAHNRQNQRGN